MHGIKYISYFKDIEDKNLYAVEIHKEGYSGAVTELTAAGKSPFTVNYPVEDFLYHPLRLSGATMRFVGGDYLRDLFTEGAQTSKVLFKKNGIIVWNGFVTPEVYSQNYSDNLFQFEIECVSALSTLEYVKFSKEGDTISLFKLISNAIEKSDGGYYGFYMPDVFRKNPADQVNFFKNISISTNNFIDEDGFPMTYKEIIEEICKTFSLYVIEKDGYVYFIDVDYLKLKKNRYFRYSVPYTDTVLMTYGKLLADNFGRVISFKRSYASGVLEEDATTLATAPQNIRDIGYGSTGSTYNIVPGYNKVNVTCSDYEADQNDLYPALEIDDYTPESIASHSMDDRGESYLKHYYHLYDRFELFQYRVSGNSFQRQLPYTMIPNDLRTIAGACVVSRANFTIKEPPRTLSYENVIQIKLWEGTNTNVLLDAKGTADNAYPIIKSVVPTGSLTFTPGTIICIDFDIQYSDREDGFVLKEKTNTNDVVLHGVTGNDRPDHWYVPVQFRIGKYYYTGEGWSTTPTTFRILTDLEAQKQHFTFDWLNCKNTNTFSWGVPDLEGRIFPVVDAKIGSVELIIYCPRQTYDRDYLHRFIYMKNITVSTQRMNRTLSKKKQDTLYSEDINAVFINQADDIDLKITSSNESELSFSKMIVNDIEILDKVYNEITGTEEKPEELIIKRVKNQYYTAKIKTEQNLNIGIVPYRLVYDPHVNDKEFVVVGEDIDFLMGETRVTLIEV